jgi:hypothetical protein
MDDTGEIFMVSVSSSDEKELAVALEDVFTSFGPLSDDVVEVYSMHVVSALKHRRTAREPPFHQTMHKRRHDMHRINLHDVVRKGPKASEDVLQRHSKFLLIRRRNA